MAVSLAVQEPGEQQSRVSAEPYPSDLRRLSLS